MGRELWLLRHGAAENDLSVGDFDRPLSDPGKRDIQRLGVWMSLHDLIPDQVVASKAERALVSAQKLCRAMQRGTQGVTSDQALYTDEWQPLLTQIQSCDAKVERLLVVGHAPALEGLLRQLLGVDMPTQLHEEGLRFATLVRLRIEGAWQEVGTQTVQLLDVKEPHTLPRKFPFPSPSGDQRRKRPAYYYRQSSVIPYRMIDGQLHFMLVSSSKKKHWVVPKGIHEPGLSAQDSAAKEAMEEAGVRGEVSTQSLGHYTYKKWGGPTTCHVYSMAVTEVIPEAQWEERHRGRQWFSPEQAMEKVNQQELVPMMKMLVKQLLAES
ncbi:NUDIX domain-containing protein [Magnetococcus sp. PR-3]|uniref:NUDIX domain-containing protein n=1 Tax=Magnetococcus sp. PR-3 TaxID=3120355 RepID=UPI002FCE66F8